MNIATFYTYTCVYHTSLRLTTSSRSKQNLKTLHINPSNVPPYCDWSFHISRARKVSYLNKYRHLRFEPHLANARSDPEAIASLHYVWSLYTPAFGIWTLCKRSRVNFLVKTVEDQTVSSALAEWVMRIYEQSVEFLFIAIALGEWVSIWVTWVGRVNSLYPLFWLLSQQNMMGIKKY